MAHFAELDENSIVLRVIVISNDDLLDENGVEQEALGLAVCRNIFGPETNWVQTSYNHTFRRKYAGIGDKFDAEANLFYNPIAPFPSWTLDSEFNWNPPTPYPTDGKIYEWNEETLTWVEVPEAGE